tara:strand:- start:1470 stop:2210 length:741 start_codon:yes stop_codon:yes gene_type:complete
MHRFFINSDLQKGLVISLKNSTSHQIKNVLRMAEGDQFELFNNSGNSFIAKYINCEGNSVKCFIEEKLESLQHGIKINVFQSIIKTSKLELIVEKLTEIGISSFTPIITERTQKKDIDSLSENKLKRLEKISIESSEQSGKVFIPTVNRVQNLSNLDISIPNSVNIVFYENIHGAKKFNSLKKEFFNNKSISVYIGPVGGFSDKEIEYFKSNESIVINLGSTIFKSDTASIVSIALLKYFISGNLN